MQKQIQKNEASLKKVAEGMKDCLEGKFQNGELIFDLLLKRERILEKTRKKLLKMNKKHFIEWEIPQNYSIS